MIFAEPMANGGIGAFTVTGCTHSPTGRHHFIAEAEACAAQVIARGAPS